MKRLAQALLAVTTLGLHAAAANAQCLIPSLGLAAGVNAAASSVSVAAGDFNRDGKQDLAVAGFDSANVALLLGDGAGGFTPADNPPFVSRPQFIASADLNGDGNPDLVVAAGSVTTVVTPLAGDGAGHFTAKPSFNLPGESQGLAVADFNNDGKADIAAAVNGTHFREDDSIPVYLGDGAGNFTQSDAAFPGFIGGEPLSIVAADFDRDGNRDVAVAIFGSTVISVLFGDGTGKLRNPKVIEVGTVNSRRPNAIASADFNRDQNPDLVVGLSGAAEATASVLLGDGKGGFSQPVRRGWGGQGTGVWAVEAGDVNSDANPDFVLAHFGSTADANAHYLSVFLGDGRGGFDTPINLHVGTGPRGAALADLNADGRTDLVSANQYAGSVSVLLNQGNITKTVTIGGSVTTAPGSPVAGAAVTLAGGASRTALTSDAGAYKFDALPCGADYTVTASKQYFDILPASVSFGGLYLTQAGAFFTATPVPKTFKLSASSVSVSEGMKSLTLSVTRTGDPAGAASVAYATADGSASERSDYTTALGNLSFSPGEVSKDITLLITDDSLVEGDETFTISLSSPAGGPSLAAPASTAVTVRDNDTQTGPNPVEFGPGFNPQFFVRQHYLDFLNREPDVPGLAFWTGEFVQCGADAQCAEVKRVNVSAAFFLSIEFQETGYLSYRARKAAFGDLTGKPVPVRRTEMLADARRIGEGVTVGEGEWRERLELNKKGYFEELTATTEFTSRYQQSLSAGQFVDALNANIGGALSQAERDALVVGLSGGGESRATVLRKVAENGTFSAREFNKAFVLMQYFGYLRRNPDDLPDKDFSGWQFWLDKLNQFNGNYIAAEMVKAFISSDEYRKRFGP